MVRRALVAGALAIPVAASAGYVAGGVNGSWSAAAAVAVVVLNFAVHGMSLAWAAGISVVAVQVTALAGVVIRMGVIAGILVGLTRVPAFAPVTFVVAAILATLALLVYEARLVLRGVGGRLDIPPDPAAAVAAERLRLREGSR